MRAAVLGPGTEPYKEEYRILLPDGRERWIDSRGLALHEATDVPRVVVVLSQDITRWKDLELELNAQRDLFAQHVAVARATTKHPALELTLENTLDVMASLMHAEGATLFLFDMDGQLTGRLVTHGSPRPTNASEARRLLTGGLVGWVARHREPALIRDVECDGRWLTIEVQRRPVRSALCVPILVGDALLAVLTLPTRERFTSIRPI